MSLSSVVQQQHQLLEQLKQLLEHEQQLLSQGSIDGEALTQVAADKTPVYEQLERLESQRDEFAQQAGFSNSPRDMQAFALQENTLNAWNAMRLVAQRVAQLNRLNGELIEHRLRHNQQMLNLLRESSAEHAPTYSASGSQSAKVQRLSSKA